MDPIDIANSKTVDSFIQDYMPPSNEWTVWTHPVTNEQFNVTLEGPSTLSQTELDACFHLIETTSAEDYKKSKAGWKPRSKRKEMKLLDLKYLLVKRDNRVEGFLSLMPTYEDDYPVIYCYEVHLSPALQRSGLGTILMKHLEFIGSKVPGAAKIMLTCFLRNQAGISFYEKLGYSRDEFSPLPQVLRDGTKVESDYIILSKAMA